MFAAITPLLVTGSIAERMRIKAFLLFVVFWEIFIYYPLAHWYIHTVYPSSHLCYIYLIYFYFYLFFIFAHFFLPYKITIKGYGTQMDGWLSKMCWILRVA